MFDPASLIILHTAMMWSCAAAFLLIRYVNSDWKFPTQWGIGFAVLPLVMLLEGHAERVNSDLWRILGFAVGFLGPALMVDGLRAFLGLPGRLYAWIGIFIVFLSGIIVFTVIYPSLSQRVLVFQLMTVGICAYLLRVVQHLSPEDHPVGPQFMRAFAIVPIAAFIAQTVLAVSQPPSAPNDDTIVLILLSATAVGMLAAIGCIILVAERLAAHVGQQAGIDMLTGLATRRTFNRKVDHAVQQYAVGGPEVSVILFDIDHFKSINDTYGHDVGDLALRAVADCARGILRPADFLARIGGDEFAILLPNTDLTDASQIARAVLERLRSLILESDSTPIRLSGSFGVASADGPDETVLSLMKRADIALYTVKRRGRNDVETQTFQTISASG